MNWSYALYTVLMWGGWVASVAFPVVYWATARWWTTPLGRHFWTYSTAVALLYTSGLVKNYFPSFAYDTALRYTLLSVAFVVLWWRLWEYFKIVFSERKRRLDVIRRIEEGEPLQDELSPEDREAWKKVL